MPKQLINTIGLLVVLGIVAIGVAVVAVPIFLQGLSTGGEIARVAQANSDQEVAIAALEAKKNDSKQLTADLDELQAGIPTTPRVYTISKLISAAAADTGVTITSITPNAPVAFVDPAHPAPADAATADAAATDAPLTGRVQIPVQVSVLATDSNAIVAFLDELRGGPRLFGDLNATIVSRGGASASIDGLAFAQIDADTVGAGK